jgi:hypothetical protein
MSIEELFCFVDDFCQCFMVEWIKLLIAYGAKKRNRKGCLSVSEIITILVLFQQSHYRDFKTFYLTHVCCHLRREFPKLISYTRFVALIPSILMPLCAFLQSIKSSSDGIAFIDSTAIAVCHRKRISSHKVFAGIANIGKTTMGWFYGFKLHLVINHRGEFCGCRITPGNVDDREPVPDITKELLGKLFGDKGYISKELFEELLDRGLQLITGIRKNMKNRLMPLWDKLMLRKRSLIESVNHQLKNVFQIEHTRHRSVINGFTNMISAILAFAIHPRKPSLQLTPNEIQVLAKA